MCASLMSCINWKCKHTREKLLTSFSRFYANVRIKCKSRRNFSRKLKALCKFDYQIANFIKLAFWLARKIASELFNRPSDNSCELRGLMANFSQKFNAVLRREFRNSKLKSNFAHRNETSEIICIDLLTINELIIGSLRNCLSCKKAFWSNLLKKSRLRIIWKVKLMYQFNPYTWRVCLSVQRSFT